MTEVDLDNLDLLDDEDDADYVRIRRSHLDDVRQAAKNSSKHRKEAEDLKREKAVLDAGLTGLTADQRDALSTLVKEPTAEALRDKAVALGFIAAPPAIPDPTAEELEAHQRAADVANGAGAPINNTVKPEEANGWDTAKLMRLNERHPDIYELLLRGESITLPAGFQ